MTSGKEYIEPCKTWLDEGTRGKAKVLLGLDLPGRVGELKHPTLDVGSNPHIGATV